MHRSISRGTTSPPLANSSRGLTFCFYAVGCGGGCNLWVCGAAAPLLIEVLLAIFIAIVCAPKSLLVAKKRISRVAFTCGGYHCAMLLIAFGFIVLMGSSIASFSANLAHYKKTLTTTYQGVLHFLKDNTHIIEILEKVTGQDIVTSIGKRSGRGQSGTICRKYGK